VNHSASGSRAVISGISVVQKVSLGEKCSCFWKHELPQVSFEHGPWESWDWLQAAAVFCSKWVIHATRTSLVKVVVLWPIIRTRQWELFRLTWYRWWGAATQLHTPFSFQFCYIFRCFKAETIMNIAKLSTGEKLSKAPERFRDTGVTKSRVLKSPKLFWESWTCWILLLWLRRNQNCHKFPQNNLL